MIVEITSPLYLTKESYRLIHEYLSERSAEDGEPIPSFDRAKQREIEALVEIPQQRFFGIEAYPTLADKAAIIFYTINKKQIFVNGNKRMSTLSLLIFLDINEKRLTVSSDDLTAKALWLAKTASIDFPVIKEELVSWVQGHLEDAGG